MNRKKYAQECTNNIVKNAMNDMQCELAYGGQYVTAHPLYKCNARVHEFGDLYVLESYSTETAVYNRQTHALYDGLRYVYGYTSTSTQHYSKFKQWLKERGYEIAVEFRYYDI